MRKAGCPMGMAETKVRELVKKALEARDFSYSPYSGYAVGAALLCGDGEIYTGCNVENAAYGPTNCAERTAVFKAVSKGKKEFAGIAITGGKAGENPESYAFPCGVCRQVLQEFAGGDFQIIVALSEKEYKIFTLRELLPHGFGGEMLL